MDPVPSRPAITDAATDDVGVLAALRDGCEETFAAFVRLHHGPLSRVVAGYVRDPGTAEEVVQEAWLGFLGSLERFAGRCSLKTWLYQIALNKARTRFQRDQKVVPFSKLVAGEAGAQEVAVDAERFQGPDGAYPRHWEREPPGWVRDAQTLVADRETVDLVQAAIADLPPAQGTVMRMRDVYGLGSEEVCNVLEISETNQRVLLHRARTKVRQALARRYKEPS